MTCLGSPQLGDQVDILHAKLDFGQNLNRICLFRSQISQEARNDLFDYERLIESIAKAICVAIHAERMPRGGVKQEPRLARRPGRAAETAKPKPFKWTAKANIILEKNARARRALEEDRCRR